MIPRRIDERTTWGEVAFLVVTVGIMAWMVVREWVG